MQIVFSRQAADQLRERYTVLELETFEVGDKLIDVFCVIPVEKLLFSNLAELNADIDLHGKFISAIARQDYSECAALHSGLTGKFGGELDSFYLEVASRACATT